MVHYIHLITNENNNSTLRMKSTEVPMKLRLRLNFSPLMEPKFRHNFNNTVDPLCTYGHKPEATFHYVLHCNLFYPKTRAPYQCKYPKSIPKKLF